MSDDVPEHYMWRWGPSEPANNNIRGRDRAAQALTALTDRQRTGEGTG